MGGQVIEPTDRKVGILGGTFDPIHFGHLVIAEEVREALSLDRVWFVPARQPPHKLGIEISSAEDRAAMVELAIEGNPAFAVSRIEMEREGPSFTVDTLEIVARQAREAGFTPEVFFILSAEAVSALPTWRSPARILELARLVVVPRPSYPIPEPGQLGKLASDFGASPDRILRVDTLPLAHSASDIRRRAAARRSIRYLVPAAVEAYVADHRLYRSDEPHKDESK